MIVRTERRRGARNSFRVVLHSFRNSRNEFRAPSDGFTLIEMILVMALLVVAVSFVAPQLSGFFRGRTLKSEGKQIRVAAAPHKERIINLMDALKKSLEKRRGPEAAKKGSTGRKELAKVSRRVGEAARPLERRVRAGKR